MELSRPLLLRPSIHLLVHSAPNLTPLLRNFSSGILAQLKSDPIVAVGMLISFNKCLLDNLGIPQNDQIKLSLCSVAVLGLHRAQLTIRPVHSLLSQVYVFIHLACVRAWLLHVTAQVQFSIGRRVKWLRSVLHTMVFESMVTKTQQ